MANMSHDRSGSTRTGGLVTGGYAGFAFGLLAVFSTASEVATPSVGGAAVIVLVCMLAGCVAGWLLQPILGALFRQP